MPRATGFDAAKEGVEKYRAMRRSIIDFFKERGEYEGSIYSLGEELGYNKRTETFGAYGYSTNIFFVATLYALISESILNIEKPSKPSQNITIKIALANKEM